jgi:hypothetical protein
MRELSSNKYILVYILLVVCIFFISKWIIQGAYFEGDLVINTIPIENIYGIIQRSGQSPLWAPELAGGYPLLANGQLGFWYPPHMILRQFLPGVWTLNISLLLHALLASVGTFLFLKHANMHRIAAATGAILLPLGATFVGKYGSLNLILPFMWVPLILLLLQLFMEYGKRKYFIGWITVNTLCILVGHPQMGLYVFFLEAIFVCCLTVPHLRRWPRALMALAGVLLTLGLTSAYFLPIIDTIPDTDRASGTLKADTHGMFNNQFTPTAFLGLIIPHPFGHGATYHGPPNEAELSCYLGPFVLILALLGACTAKKKFSPLWLLSVSLVISGLLLAIGGYSPVFTWLFNHGWNYFNAPARFFFYTDIGIIFLAAAGLDFCISRFPHTKISKISYGILIICTIAPVLLVSWFWHQGVPWKFTNEPAVAKILRTQPGNLRVISAEKISDMASENDFGIKIGNPICSTCIYRQTFISPFEQIESIALKLSNPTPQQGTIILKIYTKNGDQLRESRNIATEIQDSQWTSFQFQPIEHALDQEFYLEIYSDMPRERAPRLLLHMNPSAQYDPSGKLYNCIKGNCIPVQQADAAFKIGFHSRAAINYDALAPYVSAGFGVGSMQWYGSLPLMNIKEYNAPIGTWGDTFGPGARTMINRFATTYIIGIFSPYRYATDLEGVSLVTSTPVNDQFLRLYRNDQAFPRLHFASQIKAINETIDQINTVRTLNSKDQSVIVANIQKDTTFDTLGNTAEIVKDERTKVIIHTQQARDGFLVLRDTLVHGWIATVDNSPTHIYQVDGVFRGILVSAGNHTVMFTYKPTWLTYALYIESVSILLFFTILLVPIESKGPDAMSIEKTTHSS